MRILEAEIDLRKQTRALENRRPAIKEVADYKKEADVLKFDQIQLSERVLDVIDEIENLEHADDFQKELALLARVSEVMDEAAELLAQPNTGPDTIAAETEAIELLLQSKRINPNGGGGGGGSTPGGGGGGTTDTAALAGFGPGRDLQSQPDNRPDRAREPGTCKARCPKSSAPVWTVISVS